MSNRRLYKRKAAQILNDTDRAMVGIDELFELFNDGQHETYAQMLETIMGQYLIARQLIKAFWEYAWGPFPDNPDTYRK